jgi:DNA invertase Pin-like site-specific DNA recombinase
MDIDTASATGRLMMTMMGAVASFETSLMRERQRVGIAAARAAGLYKGRAPTARAKAPEVRRLADAGVKPVEIARLLNISLASYYRIAKTLTADGAEPIAA